MDTRFPLVANSRAMRDLLARVKRAMAERQAVPLIVGPNTIELRAFLRRVAKDADLFKGRIRVKRERQPTLDGQMLSGEERIVVLEDGDNVSQGIQLSWSAGGLAQRVSLLLLIVTRDTRALASDPSSPWTRGFLRYCTQTIVWPALHTRLADRGALINEMCRRIGSNGKRGVPVFHHSAVDLLASTPFEGTEDVFAMLQRGYARYCEAGASHLTAKHLIGEELSAASAMSQRPTFTPPS